jgi:sugar/nucleoside kinase (ribokinase family)
VTHVVVVGDVMVDVVARMAEPLQAGSDTAAQVTTRPGGSAANVAAWLAVAGVPVTLAGRVGDDDVGRGAVAKLRGHGVDAAVAIDDRLATGTCVVLVDAAGERSMLPDAGANAALAPADLPAERFVAGAHLHLTGYTLIRPGSRDAALHALALARRAGMTISVDPSSAAPLRAAGPERFLRWVAGADVLLPNRDEAAALTGHDDPAAAARALAANVATVVVTLGAEGALWDDGSRPVRVPAVRDAAVLDTTGAGDAFAAGFLAAWLADTAPADALAAGCRLAARAVGVLGAR